MPAVNATIYASLKSAVSESQGTAATPSIDAGNFLDFGRASVSGSGADEVARAAIEAHAGNAEIHVTSTEKAAWDGKAEISDIPSKLPADGGNADTVDGKHAADIMNMEFSFINRTSITEGDLNNYTAAGAYVVLQSIAEDTLANQPFYNIGYYLNVYRRNATLITQIAMTWDGLIKIRFCDAEKWYDWKNIADGGNAASVGAYTETKLAELESRIAALEAK